MAVILAQILRTAIMALVSAAPLTVAQEFLDGTVRQLVEAIKSEHGLSTDEAKDILVNILADLAINATIIGTILKTKVALKTADYLGFTSKGVAKRTLSPKAAAAVKKMSGPWEKFKAMSLVSKLLSGAAAIAGFTWITIGIANVVEPGIYQPKQANEVWQSVLGIRPFPEPARLDSPGPFTASKFIDFAAAIEATGVAGINNPGTRQTQLYTRLALAQLVDYVYGKLLLDGASTTETSIKKEIGQYLIVPGRTASAPTAQNATSVQSGAVPKTKVFVGALGAGTLTSAGGFTARPDDLIESMDELELALRNNLTPFLASALGRFVYETRVVASVTTKDGFTQRGKAQQVISGYYADGTPRYKTVVNKFAVADVYFVTESGTRTKAGRIVLGPTDAVKFQPNNATLNNLDLAVKGDIVTSNTATVTGVKQGSTTAQLPTPDAQPYATKMFTTASDTAVRRLFRAGASNGNPPPDQLYADTGKRIYLVPNLAALGAGIFESTEEYVKLQEGNKHYDTIRARLKERYNIDFDSLPTRNPADLEREALLQGYEAQDQYNPAIGNIRNPIYIAQSIDELVRFAEGGLGGPAIGIGSACRAESLKAFFEARGEVLPPIETRSVLYEQFKLGPRGFYTGTGDQNIKLLAALKAQAGCPIA